MKRTLRLLALAAAALTGGCGRAPATTTVCLLDVSKSITPEGFRLEFEVVGSLAGRMRRGDQLILIPITGNALSNAPGHILRLTAPVRREPYDADLAAFRKAAAGDLKEMEDFYSAHRTDQTDILGTLDVAQSEFASAEEDSRPPDTKILMIFSDLIEDDGEYRFASISSLASETTACALADQIGRANGFSLGGVSVVFVNLQSTDLRRLSHERQRAIAAFWLRYASAGTPSPSVRIRY